MLDGESWYRVILLKKELTNVLGMIVSHVSKKNFFEILVSGLIGLEIVSAWVKIIKTTNTYILQIDSFQMKDTKIPTTFILSYFLFSFLF